MPKNDVYIASCAKDGGIYHYKQSENGRLSFAEKYPLDRPMYLVIKNGVLYALLRAPFGEPEDGSFEGANSGLAAFHVNADGSLTKTDMILSTHGDISAHLAVDDEKNVYTANYISGSVTKINTETKKYKLVFHKGKSVHPTRQASPHTHNIVFTPDQKALCVTDLGIDEIVVYDKELSRLSSCHSYDGAGPRHMVFSPDGKYAFCADELGNTVTAYTFAENILTRKKSFSTIPSDFTGATTTAAIRITSDGKYLFVSNRGHDSIASFEVSGEELKPVGIYSCNGKSPRDFNLDPDEKYIVCTNETSGNITVFERKGGKLRFIGEDIPVPAVLSVIFGE